jgi:peptide/nickel transport system permease protein
VRNYVLRRLLVAVPSLLIASLIVFTLPRLIPGDVVQLMLEEKAYGKDLEDLRAKLGLNRPIPVQYIEWLGAVVRGNLGESLWTRQPVLTELGRRLPVSATLGAMALLVAVAIGLPIGVIAAVRQDGVLDFFARSAAVLGLSVPAFVLALVVTLLPAIWWGWTPRTQFVPFSTSPPAFVVQFALPAIILGITSAAGIMRLTRGMLLEVLRHDYVRTAWATSTR